MNPVFWLLLFITVVITWFAISGLFIPIGRMLIKKWDRLEKLKKWRKKIMSKRKAKIAGGIFTGIALIITLIVVINCMERIPVGYAGVIYSMNGAVKDNT